MYKIGILVTILDNFGKRGYYQSQEIGLGRELVSMGHTVVIYKSVKEKEEEKELLLENNLQIKYIYTKRVGIHGIFPENEIDTSLDGLLSFSDTQIFISHIYSYCLKNHIVFIPYVGVGHNMHQSLNTKVLDRIFKQGTLKVYKELNVLVKTPDAQKELKDLGVTDASVAPVGLDTTVLKMDYRNYDRNKIRQEYGYTQNDVIISFISKLESYKDPIGMLLIFKNIVKVKPYKLLIVGSGSLEYQLKEKINVLKLSEYVKVIYKVPYKEMWKIHYISDFYVSLDREEMFGMSIMEGIFYETSVIAMNAPGPNYILPELEGHHICKNYNQVTAFLQEEIPNKEILKKSSDYVIKKFSWEPCANKLLKIIENQKATMKGVG